MSTFDDYEKAVVAYYHYRKEKGELSLLLVNLKPANLKKECRIVCQERYSRKDEQILRAFFEQAGNKEAILQSIELCKIDKFKPLIQFLNGETNKPAEKQIELLAWLVDFRPRPHDSRNSYENPDISVRREMPAQKTKIEESRDELVNIEDEEDVDEDEKELQEVVKVKKAFNFNLWKGAIVIGLLGVLVNCARVYWSKSNEASLFQSIGPQTCMFWDGERFRQISCSSKPGDTMVVALDSQRLNQVMKITRPDTITDAAIGHVWYCRYRGNYEFYTGGGYHPLDPNLRLKPITHFIIGRHVPVDGKP